MSERGEHRGPPDVTALLQHRQWLQRLASHLVTPGTTTEDALQDTWVTALRAGPREAGRARSWLARVLMNAIRRQLRGERRRVAREQAVAEGPEQVQQPAAAGLERLQLQRRLIALVDALEEPFRSTVVLRYFEDRSATEIARATGVPEGTVRWRTHEALSRLRRALDDQAGGDRRAWMVPVGTLAGPAASTVQGRPLLWLAGGALVIVLAGSAAVLQTRVTWDSAGAPPAAHVDRASPRESGMRAQASTPPGAVPTSRPMLAAAALALASRPIPPAEALVRARALWARACPESTIDGICAAATPPSGRVCPQAAAAGPRLAALPRHQVEREQAIALWTNISADRPLPYELRIQADLALAEDKLESMLAVEPLSGIALDRHAPIRFEQDHRRFQDWAREMGRRTTEATWALERLSGASDELPEVHLARARLGQAWAEAARLKLAMQIPEGLAGTNRWGKDEQSMFCQSIAKNVDGLLEKARRQFRYCADGARTRNPAAAALCTRELARLPPESAGDSASR
jgi:RNA polymerase sigma-70 factor (ECF subfamily)